MSTIPSNPNYPNTSFTMTNVQRADLQTFSEYNQRPDVLPEVYTAELVAGGTLNVRRDTEYLGSRRSSQVMKVITNNTFLRESKDILSNTYPEMGWQQTQVTLQPRHFNGQLTVNEQMEAMSAVATAPQALAKMVDAMQHNHTTLIMNELNGLLGKGTYVLGDIEKYGIPEIPMDFGGGADGTEIGVPLSLNAHKILRAFSQMHQTFASSEGNLDVARARIWSSPFQLRDPLIENDGRHQSRIYNPTANAFAGGMPFNYNLAGVQVQVIPNRFDWMYGFIDLHHQIRTVDFNGTPTKMISNWLIVPDVALSSYHSLDPYIDVQDVKRNQTFYCKESVNVKLIKPYAVVHIPCFLRDNYINPVKFFSNIYLPTPDPTANSADVMARAYSTMRDNRISKVLGEVTEYSDPATSGSVEDAMKYTSFKNGDAMPMINEIINSKMFKQHLTDRESPLYKEMSAAIKAVEATTPRPQAGTQSAPKPETAPKPATAPNV